MASVANRLDPGDAVIADSGCWIWQHCIQANGYGRLRRAGRSEYAHRASFLKFKGQIPDGLDVCHTCDNRKCWNPDHLFLGTRTDNMHDAVRKGRTSKGQAHAATICGEHGPGAKLTLSEVRQIRALKIVGAATPQLAKRFGVCTSTIRNIVYGRTWKDESLCEA